MLDSLVYLWFIAGLLLLLVELLTPGFIVVCFGIGALLAVLPTALGASITWQVITFCIGLILALLLLRLMVHRLSRNEEPVRTGVEALYGHTARVIECIDVNRETGRITVDGGNWYVHTMAPDMTIPYGGVIRIVSSDSIVIVVEPITQSVE